MKNSSLNILLALFAILSFSQTYAQSKTPEEFKKLGRDSIIKLAMNFMDNKIEPANYDIRVLANKTNVVVSFYIPVKYVPYNSEYFYDAVVDMTNEFISYDNYSNPREYQNNQVSFYKPNKEDQKNIEFIINAISENGTKGGIPPIDLTNFKDHLIIRETPKHFDIVFVSETYDLTYKINRKSGKISDLVTGYIEPQPIIEGDDEVDEYEEIK